MSGLCKITGWLRRWAGPAFLCVLGLRAVAQGPYTYQHYVTANPDPNFPWDYQGQRVLNFNPVSMTIDLNQDGTADYLIGTGGAQSTLGFYIYGLQQENRVWSELVGSFQSRYVVALDSGDFIGPDGSSVFDWVGPEVVSGTTIGPAFTVAADVFTIGYFTGVESAYCGLQMQVSGQTHYGWVRVGNPLAGINGGWVYDSVFNNTPGQSLLAGAGGVPEPSAFALFSLGGLALIWMQRRRNKSSQIVR